METKTLTLKQVEKVLWDCRKHPGYQECESTGRARPAHRFSESTVREIMDDMELEAR
jgi:hypothetical protein